MSDEPRLTDRELDAMSVLWRNGSGTVGEVREQLADDLAYTTVLWVMQTLEEKGFARHEKVGRAYRYYPTIGQEEAGGSALNRIVDKVFHGSAAMLLAQLVSERRLPAAELERMRDLLDRRLAEEEDA
ncbi:MAG TPA: BlaI/MecI/CopY family transcriptional regulator [Longimicrobiaceae bacterium]|nr:BlaI/MecI/CopY family transcriptional regulator [Longimicrobiaceae bacterium]